MTTGNNYKKQRKTAMKMYGNIVQLIDRDSFASLHGPRSKALEHACQTSHSRVEVDTGKPDNCVCNFNWNLAVRN